MDKVEISGYFIRELKRIVNEFDELSDHFRKKQNEPKSQINTEEEHKMNLLIFRGEYQAYGYATEKLRNLLIFEGLWTK